MYGMICLTGWRDEQGHCLVLKLKSISIDSDCKGTETTMCSLGIASDMFYCYYIQGLIYKFYESPVNTEIPNCPQKHPIHIIATQITGFAS